MKTKAGVLFFMIILITSFSSALLVDSVLTNPSEISPGEVSTIRIILENNQGEDVEEVSILLDLKEVPFAPHQSSSEFSIGKIRKERTDYATFKIKAFSDAEAGIYRIPLKVSYKEKDQVINRESLISIIVNSPPILSSSVEEGFLIKGQENQILVRITNKGLSGVKFLEVEIIQGSDYSLLSPKNSYLGNLDSDDFDSAEFKIYLKENVPTNLRIPVVLSYKDTLNKEFQETTYLSLKAYDKKQAEQMGLIEKSNTLTYVAIAIILILVYLIFRRIRNASKKKREKEV